MRLLSSVGEILLAGLLALLPLYLTIQVLVWIFGFVDEKVGALVELAVGRHIPGTGLVLTLALVLLVGLLTRWWVTQKIIHWLERAWGTSTGPSSGCWTR
jgi:uncharacterized membrane protein